MSNVSIFADIVNYVRFFQVTGSVKRKIQGNDMGALYIPYIEVEVL